MQFIVQCGRSVARFKVEHDCDDHNDRCGDEGEFQHARRGRTLITPAIAGGSRPAGFVEIRHAFRATTLRSGLANKSA